MGVVGWVVDPQDYCVSPWPFENGASTKIDDVLAEESEDGGLLHGTGLHWLGIGPGGIWGLGVGD